ncbi:MAG TPA: hypothetical protein VGK73_05785 [Polyangiaceae bacterium]
MSQRESGVVLLFGLIAALVLTVGCKKKDETPSAPAPSASAQRAAPPAPNVDQKLLAELEELAKVCQADAARGTLECPNGEQNRLSGEFVSRRRDRAKATATLAAALSSEKPGLRAAGANLLHSAFRAPWGTNLPPGSVAPADADALLRAVLALPKAQALPTLPAAVHASVIAGRGDALLAALDKLGDAQLRTSAIRYLMSHGRLQVFPKIQEYGAAEDLQLVLSALESPSNMYNWTSAEQAAICPWAGSFLDDKRPPVAAKAGALLGNCGGEQVDRLLEKGEASLKAGEFSSTELAAFRDLCAQHRRSRPGSPSPEQCARVRKLLENVTRNAALTEQAQTTALAALAYQWPDDATLKLARRLAKDPKQKLAESAAKTAARLEQRLSPGSTAAAAGSARPAPAAAGSGAPPSNP